MNSEIIIIIIIIIMLLQTIAFSFLKRPKTSQESEGLILRCTNACHVPNAGIVPCISFNTINCEFLKTMETDK